MSGYINYDSLTGQVRTIVPAIITWMVAHGWGWAGTTWGQIGTVVVVTVICCAWSVLNNPAGKTIPSTLSGRP